MELVIIVERAEVVQNKSISFTSHFGMPLQGEWGVAMLGWRLQCLKSVLCFGSADCCRLATASFLMKIFDNLACATCGERGMCTLGCGAVIAWACSQHMFRAAS